MSRGTPELTAVDLLELAPVRRAEWEERDDRVVVHRPPLPGRGLRARLARLMDTRPKVIRLDELGSFAWSENLLSLESAPVGQIR